MSTNNNIEWWRCERKNLEKSIKRHRPNSHKRTTMCEVNKLLFLYSHSEMKSYAKKHFFFCAVQKFVCIFVLYFDKYIYLFIFYEAPFSSVCCACTFEKQKITMLVLSSPFRPVHVYVFWCLLYNNCWCC